MKIRPKIRPNQNLFLGLYPALLKHFYWIVYPFEIHCIHAIDTQKKEIFHFALKKKNASHDLCFTNYLDTQELKVILMLG